MKVFRSIGAVLLGYLVFAVSAFGFFQLSGQDPHQPASAGVMVGSIAVGLIAAFVGGYLSAWLAGRKPLVHGMAMAAILALGAAISLASTLGHGAVWSQCAALLLMAPSAVMGGWMRSWQKRNS